MGSDKLQPAVRQGDGFLPQQTPRLFRVTQHQLNKRAVVKTEMR